MQAKHLVSCTQDGYTLRLFQENPETCVHIVAPVVKVQAILGTYQCTQLVARSELDGSDGNGLQHYVLGWAINHCRASIGYRTQR